MKLPRRTMVGSRMTLRVRRATPKAAAHMTRPIRKTAHHDGAQRSAVTTSGYVKPRGRRMHRKITEEDADGPGQDDRTEPERERPANPTRDLKETKVERGNGDGTDERGEPKRNYPIGPRTQPHHDKVGQQPTDDRDRDQVEMLLERAQQCAVEPGKQRDAAKWQGEATEQVENYASEQRGLHHDPQDAKLLEVPDRIGGYGLGRGQDI